MSIDKTSFGPCNSNPGRPVYEDSKKLPSQPALSIQSKVGKVVLDKMAKMDNPYTKSTLYNRIRPFSERFGKGHSVAHAISTQPQQNTYVPKDSAGPQQKNISQKAVAVVAPLAQQVVPCVQNANEVGLHRRPIPVEQHQHVKYKLQPRVNESGLESLFGNAMQAVKMPLESVLGTGFSQSLELEGPVESNEHTNQSNSYSMPLSRINMEREESMQLSHMEDQCSARFLLDENYTTAINQKTKINIEWPDGWSALPVTKWSLQKLRILVADSEHRQKEFRTEIPFTDLSSEIIKLYWNGDYRKLCDAVSSDQFISIMKEVKLHCGKENSLIIQDISKEAKDQLAEDFHIFKDNSGPQAVVDNSLLLNSTEKVFEEQDQSLCSLTFHSTLEADEVIERQKIKRVPEREVSYETLSGTVAIAQAQSHKNKCLEYHVKQEPRNMDIKKKETVQQGHLQECLTENQTPKNEDVDQHKLSASEDCDNEDFADPFVFVKIKVFSPQTAKEMFARASDKPQNIQKDVSVQTLNKNCNHLMVKRPECISEDEEHMDTKKTTERNRAHTTEQIERYCCLAKWFKVLGYANYTHCTCENKTELRTGNSVVDRGVADGTSMATLPAACNASVNGIETVDAVTDNKNVLANGVLAPQTNKPLNCGPHTLKKRKHYRCVANGQKRTHHTTCQVAPKMDSVINLSNDASQMEVAVTLTSTNKPDVQGGEKTNVELQKKGRILNLALYGSDLRHNGFTSTNNYTKKNSFGIRASDNGHFPPVTVNIRVDSCSNANSNSRETTKQRILKSWRNSYVPTNTMNDSRRSKKAKYEGGIASKSDAICTSDVKKSTCSVSLYSTRTFQSHQEDLQTPRSVSGKEEKKFSVKQKSPVGQSKKKGRCTRKETVKNCKPKETLQASINPTNRQNTDKECTSIKSSFKLSHNFSKSKYESHESLALDFKVLPKSFSFTNVSSMMETDQPANLQCEILGQNTENLKKDKTMRDPGVWCFSPRKKGHLKSELASNVSVTPNTFQEFKRRYEEKKQRLLQVVSGSKSNRSAGNDI